MAIGEAFAVAAAGATPATSGVEYSGRVTPFVILSCVVAGSGGLLFGYDLGISGGVTSMNSFLKRFFPEVYRQKQESKVSHYCQFNSELLTLFTSSLYIAGLVATLIASTVTRRFGRRASMLIGGTVFIVGSVFGGAAVNVPMLLLNRILLGVGLGFTNQSIPLYLSEMAPPQYRGAINNGFELAISLGILFTNILNYFVVRITAGWGWRISLSIAAVPATFLTIGAFFLPETPSFIIHRHGDTSKARILLQKLRGTTSVQTELDDLVAASNLSKTTQYPFRNIFKRKTIGLKESASLLSAVVTRLCATFANIVAMIVVDRFGRRKLLLVGGVQMILSQFIVGAILAVKFKDHGDMDRDYAYLVLIMMCVFVAGFGWSWGPLTFLVPAESAVFFVFGGWICLMTLFVYLFLPESKKLPMEQMEQVWRRHWFWKKVLGEDEKKQAGK
ncbi:hypothetical protein QOZ80_2AG0116660 [Eleusine coracana subsp. coracana]|nr:hypothetical protein QOZ80_2AG0116660 [Eleusine coracana subsp. coracana]